MPSARNPGVLVGPLEESDLSAADAVFRLAFGTAMGLPEPQRFAEGAELVRTRWRGDHTSAVKAEAGGELVGCAFVTFWGSYAVFGPIAVRPDYWGGGVGRLLWEARMPLLERRGTTHASLFTRVEPKNIHLYGTFGFWPGSLTALVAKQIEARPDAGVSYRTFAELSAVEGVFADCRRVTDALHEGLDLEPEIRALDAQGLGDTIVLDDDGGLAGFALCHAGEGTEAGPGTCYVKFAAVASGEGAAARFERLLGACEAYAARREMTRITAGVNLGREDAARMVLGRGYRTFALGVAMHRPNEPAWDRSGAYVLDDRR